MSFYIDSMICPQDHACPLIKMCPADAIHQNKNGLPIIDEEKCVKCGKCARQCPKHAAIKR